MQQRAIWGERVGIRPLLPNDAAAIRRLVSNPEVADLLFEDMGSPIPSVFTLALFIAGNWLQGRPEWAIVTRQGTVVGSVRLWRVSDRNRSAMLTIFVGPRENWGKGYGTDALRLALHQAFGPMGLERVELHVFDFNQRAIRSYERAGFAWEGVRRQALFRSGQFHDIIVMGILKDEFQAREAERKSAAERKESLPAGENTTVRQRVEPAGQ